MDSFPFENLSIAVFPDVYEPAEDSFLLAKHAVRLKGKILEIGCGTGIVSLFIAKNNPKNSVIGVDINPAAVKNSEFNRRQNRIKNAVFLNADLFSKIKKSEKFNAIVFNPPYLPTTKKEKIKGKLNAAFDGGRTGRKILDRFLTLAPEFMKPKGKLLIVHSSLNNPKKTIKILEKQGFRIRILEQENFFFEKIMVLEASLF